ncbi:hypothetical protein K469DRAFT_537682, partial [Zopfia rhizophila CBS 207.26]
GRRIFRTSYGYVCLGPQRTQSGERICVLLGSNYPLMLYPVRKESPVVGECYVNGLMEGEALGRFLL